MEMGGESDGQELEKERGQDGVGGPRAVGAAPRGGGGTAEPSEISRNEARPETLRAVLENICSESGGAAAPTTNRPGPLRAAQTFTGMRSSNASHSTGSTSQTSQI